MNRTKSLVTLLLLYVSLFAMDDAAEAQAAAEKGYYNFLKLCLSAEGAHERHRLAGTESAENASLGDAIPVNHLTAESVDSYSGGTVKELLAWRSIYYVPVLFDGVPKLMLTVRKFSANGEYEIAALGDGLLMKQIVAIRQKHRAADAMILCFNSDIRQFSFHLPSVDETNLTAIRYTLPAERSGNEYEELSTAKITIATLQQKIAEQKKRGYQW